MLALKTLVMFDDIFFLCMVGGKDNFCLLPGWEDRIVKIQEYEGKV